MAKDNEVVDGLEGGRKEEVAEPEAARQEAPEPAGDEKSPERVEDGDTEEASEHADTDGGGENSATSAGSETGEHEADSQETAEAAGEPVNEKSDAEKPGGDKLDEEAPPRPRQPTYVEQLERRLIEAQDQLREYIKAYKKEQAETAELKDRLEREAVRELEKLRGDLASQFFEVLDNLDRSIGAAESKWDAEAFMKGIKMVRGQFIERLQGFGIEVIDPEGDLFDPSVADALNLVPTDDPEKDGTVAMVYVKGYRLKDRVIRPAQVAVYQTPDGG